MNMRRAVFKLIRCRNLPQAGGGTLFFMTEGLDRKHLPKFFNASQVPEFEGEYAWFECERLSRAHRWRVVRRVQDRP
jgi:hypothetical protein